MKRGTVRTDTLNPCHVVVRDVTTQYEGVVYDLDGTLVNLDVDWTAVKTDVEAVYRSAGVPVDGRDLWGLFEDAPTHGLRDSVHEAIAAHERDGAYTSTRLPHADRLGGETRPIAVCSLNCEDACRIALETHDLDHCVDAVIGRDTVETYKPDPLPLLAAIASMGLHPSVVVFVGDTARDEKTAVRAGTAFEYV
jgi:phosphoglycolate phosphatase